MKLTLEALVSDLARRLLPIYLVSGDEPLLVGEALDAVRARARAGGFSEREVFFVERQAAVWDEIQHAAQALSLFASRRIVEVRLPSGKPGVSGAAVLSRLLAASGEELLVLIQTGQLERETQALEWVQVVQARGAWVPVWPVPRQRLPQWLRARLAAAGLNASEAALELLAERSEGNLLAARQEIDKLALLLPRGARVELEDVAAGSADSARFDVFQLGEAVREADAARALRILGSLRAKGTEPTLVLWALLRELHAAHPQGSTSAAVAGLLARAARADRMAKGLLSGDAWDELSLLAVELAGRADLSWMRAG